MNKPNNIVLIDFPFEVDAAELIKSARVPEGGDDEEEFRTLFRRAMDVARPKALYRPCYVEKKAGKNVRINGVDFQSHALRRNLDEVERVFAYVASCGREINCVKLNAQNLLHDFWLDTIKGALLDCSIQALHEDIEQRYGIGQNSTMNPGASDATIWPIEQQEQLFELLDDVEGSIGVELTDSHLMVPNKSISGILFPTEVDFRNCQLCRRENCPSRSAPFEPEMWETLQRERGEGGKERKS